MALDATRDAVRHRSEGARLEGRRRPRRTGRVIEGRTPHEQAMASARLEGVVFARAGGGDVRGRNVRWASGSAGGAAEADTPTPSAEDVAVRLAAEDGSRLQRALASLGVTPEDLQEALADVAADSADDGQVEIDLGEGATLTVATGNRAANLRSLIAAADHVTAVEGPDGTLRAEAPALGDAVWATLEGWLTV